MNCVCIHVQYVVFTTFTAILYFVPTVTSCFRFEFQVKKMHSTLMDKVTKSEL